MKLWQITELKKLLKLRNDVERKGRMMMTITQEFSFPQIELRDPLWFWREAAKRVNSELGFVESRIRDLLVSKTLDEWKKKKENYGIKKR